MEFKIIKEIFSDCLGAMYIDLVHIASEKFLSADTLHSFCNDLWTELYFSIGSELNIYNNDLYICIGESEYCFNNLTRNLDDSTWYRVSCQDGDPSLFQVEPIKGE